MLLDLNLVDCLLMINELEEGTHTCQISVLTVREMTMTVQTTKCLFEDFRTTYLFQGSVHIISDWAVHKIYEKPGI